MDEKRERTFHQLTEEPVGRLICRLAVPCIVSMLVTTFYNMADTFFVGMLGSNSATAAVGVAFSLMALFQAVGSFFAHGSGNFISRELGRQNQEAASAMAATGVFSALLLGAVLCLLGQLFLEPLARLLGSTDTILPYSMAYLRVILYGAPWIITSLVLNTQLRFQGSAVYGMVGITSGAVVNIALDPLLIFVLDLGIAGAAWATVISQFLGFCLLLAGCARGGNLRIRPSQIQLRRRYLAAIFQGGLPSLGRQGLTALATIALNWAVRPYGDAAIAAMGVVQRIAAFGASALIGFGQGFQPVCGFNYGARLYSRVRAGFRFCVRTSLGFLLAVSALGFLFAPELIALFRDDPDVVAVGAAALRFQCVTFCSMGYLTMSSMMLQTIGRTVSATFLSTARQGVFFIPLALLLPAVLGLPGVQLTQSAADLLSLTCAIPIQRRVLRQLDLPDGTPLERGL